MGILPEIATLIAGLSLPPGFSVCELGAQDMAGGKRRSAEDWYASLGCARYVSIDANGKGTLTHDLNRAVPPFQPFDLVTDFGTGEHIFDQAQVWVTLNWLTKVGGLIAFDRPAQGYSKHCYYLTNKCLYTDIASANGYEVVYLKSATTPRGTLIRGIFRRTSADHFVVPQQGRYRESLAL